MAQIRGNFSQTHIQASNVAGQEAVMNKQGDVKTFNGPVSLLQQAADSLEELSILISNRKYKEKKLDKRKGKSAIEQAAAIAKRINQIRRVAEGFGRTYPDLIKNKNLAKQLLGLNDDELKERFPHDADWQKALQEKYNNRFAELIQLAITNPDKNVLLKAIKDDHVYFPESCHKKTATDKILEVIAETAGVDSDAYRSVSDALNELLADPKVKHDAIAGENTSAVIYETIEAKKDILGEDLSIVNIGSFRDVYCEHVKEPGSTVLVFSALEQKFGESKFPTFEAVMDIMLVALGRDLDAKDSSIEKAELENIIAALQNVRAIMFVFNDISTLLVKTQDNY